MGCSISPDLDLDESPPAMPYLEPEDASIFIAIQEKLFSTSINDNAEALKFCTSFVKTNYQIQALIKCVHPARFLQLASVPNADVQLDSIIVFSRICAVKKIDQMQILSLILDAPNESICSYALQSLHNSIQLSGNMPPINNEVINRANICLQLNSSILVNNTLRFIRDCISFNISADNFDLRRIIYLLISTTNTQIVAIETLKDIILKQINIYPLLASLSFLNAISIVLANGSYKAKSKAFDCITILLKFGYYDCMNLINENSLNALVALLSNSSDDSILTSISLLLELGPSRIKPIADDRDLNESLERICYLNPSSILSFHAKKLMDMIESCQ